MCARLKALARRRSCIQTDRGHLIQISILRDDMFRVWAGADGKLIGAGDKAAPIVLTTDFAKPEVSISEQRDYQLIQTKAMALRVYRINRSALLCTKRIIARNCGKNYSH